MFVNHVKYGIVFFAHRGQCYLECLDGSRNVPKCTSWHCTAGSFSVCIPLEFTAETPEGVLGSRENGVQNNQGARSRIQK